MFRQMINWKTGLALVAILIVIGTIFYSRYLARKIANDEKQKVEQWVRAGQSLMSKAPDADTRLENYILIENKTIPIIWTDEKDSVIDHINLDTAKARTNGNYIQKKLKQ